MDISPGSLLVIDSDGKSVPKEAIIERLRFARIVRVSTEGNASLCRDLLAARYDSRGATHDDSREEAAL